MERPQTPQIPLVRPQSNSHFNPARINHRAFSYYPRVSRVDSHLRAHISDPLTLGQAANLVGLEKTYFSAYFHKRSGVRSREWLAYVRVQRAKDLLRVGTGSIRNFCLAVGYRDLRTFQRNFHKSLPRISNNGVR